MSLGGGDKLARGGKTAQFAGGHSSVDDEVVINPSVLAQDTEEMPDKQEVGVTVVDKRRSYIDRLGEKQEEVKKEIKEFPDYEYSPLNPILDRILVMRVVDENVEILEDGSARDKKTGFIIPAAYRQHTNEGVVLAVGSGVVIGGVYIPVDDIFQKGDRVFFGEYNAEMFPMKIEEIKALCREAKVNYMDDGTGALRLVRIQDVRGFRRRK